ncbi:hypothetical protein RclHR1_00450003 [Rhizophagus clarus]|uniref:Uncharacterized protein n=1 Tax=Rhizophagus clarus TaxID=94130 RepID=A0A2Z6RHE9_9GLOM|nr:hypothetical protein RclHR1_00450003 [Rhizophagus clarus]
MLQTPDAQFHIRFLNQHWLISNQSNSLKNRSFYPAMKLKNESDVQFLDHNTISDFSNSIDKNFNFNAKQIACKSCDESFIILFEEYINKKNREALNLQLKENQHQVIIDEQEVDQENIIPIGNPIIRHPKGKPPGTTRFKGPLQTSTQPNEALTGQKYGLCSKNGHNRATYLMNQNQKKRSKLD